MAVCSAVSPGSMLPLMNSHWPGANWGETAEAYMSTVTMFCTKKVQYTPKQKLPAETESFWIW